MSAMLMPADRRQPEPPWCPRLLRRTAGGCWTDLAARVDEHPLIHKPRRQQPGPLAAGSLRASTFVQALLVPLVRVLSLLLFPGTAVPLGEQAQGACGDRIVTGRRAIARRCAGYAVGEAQYG